MSPRASDDPADPKGLIRGAYCAAARATDALLADAPTRKNDGLKASSAAEEGTAR